MFHAEREIMGVSSGFSRVFSTKWPWMEIYFLVRFPVKGQAPESLETVSYD